MIENIEDLLDFEFDDLDQIDNVYKFDIATHKYSSFLENIVLQYAHFGAPNIELDKISVIIDKAWSVLNLAHKLCNKLRDCGGLKLLINNCVSKDQIIQFSSARLLEKCLTLENREYVLDNGVEKVMHVVCEYKTQFSSVDMLSISAGILEKLFKHSEIMCSDVIQLGGLDVLIFDYRNRDEYTLQYCASALANLSLYGEPKSQEVMLKRNVPTWLLTLALNTEVDIKYYAFLAIAVLVTNKETKSATKNVETPDLIDPVNTIAPHSCGKNHEWLKRLVPLLSSTRDEACNLAAFHFCMEAGIKSQLGTTSILKMIGVIKPLKRVASCGNTVASKLAAKALRLIKEDVSCKLSQYVHLWSEDEVHEWAYRSGFSDYAKKLLENRVDGDILLQLTEDELKVVIDISKEITGIRFMLELCERIKSARYNNKDCTDLHSFLKSIGTEYTVYTYPMWKAGINMKNKKDLTEGQLKVECRISNDIHRKCILETIKVNHTETLDNVDVFISYRRSNGSSLASLLSLYLTVRGYQVFMDVVHLENGKFGYNLLKNIKKAKNLVLVLTEKSLDRRGCEDWVYKEIATAIRNQINIIPVVYNFTWPETLPTDISDLRTYDMVPWSYHFQDESVEAIVTTMHRQRVTGG